MLAGVACSDANKGTLILSQAAIQLMRENMSVREKLQREFDRIVRDRYADCLSSRALEWFVPRPLFRSGVVTCPLRSLVCVCCWCRADVLPAVSEELYKIFSFCRRLDKTEHPLPVNLSRLIINAQKRFNIDRNQVLVAH